MFLAIYIQKNSREKKYHQTVKNQIKSIETTIQTLEDRYDSNCDFSITLRKHKSMDIHVCICSQDNMFRSGHVCYHDREQHLRRDDHRPQGIAVWEGKARYGHQGGGKRQADQVLVNLKRIIQEKKKKKKKKKKKMKKSQLPGLLQIYYNLTHT
jgi:hypothetical protein